MLLFQRGNFENYYIKDCLEMPSHSLYFDQNISQQADYCILNPVHSWLAASQQENT